MTNPSAIATIPTNRAIIPFMRQLMEAGSLCIAIGGTLHWMALPVQLRFAQKFLARSSSAHFRIAKDRRYSGSVFYGCGSFAAVERSMSDRFLARQNSFFAFASQSDQPGPLREGGSL